MYRRYNTAHGFTLIELLLVISIAVMFLTIALSAAQTGRQSARDAQRKTDLKQLQTYLELYKDQNGAYPSTGGQWFSSESGDVVGNNSSGGGWIPNLAPGYIGALPRDPLGGPSKISLCSGWLSSYLYRSDGSDYKILAHCSPEVLPISNSDPFYDSIRPTHAFTVCTPGGCGW